MFGLHILISGSGDLTVAAVSLSVWEAETSSLSLFPQSVSHQVLKLVPKEEGLVPLVLCRKLI